MFLVFDTETTGLPRDYSAPITDTENWPRMVQIAWQLHDERGELMEVEEHLVQPDGFDIPFNATKIHGITTERAAKEGKPLNEVLDAFTHALSKAKYAVGHNIGFDINIVGCEFYRRTLDSSLSQKIVLDTCTEKTAALCQLPGGRGGKFKLPNLTELHSHLFNERFDEAHNAAFDVEATARVFLELLRTGQFDESELQVDADFIARFRQHNPKPFELIGLASKEAKTKREEALEDLLAGSAPAEKEHHHVADIPFAHLHNHSQFSILQATTGVKALVQKAHESNMPGVALTDNGNLMAAFRFTNAVLSIPENAAVHQHNKSVVEGKVDGPLKPYPFKGVVGCEFNLCEDHSDKSKKDNGYQIVALAKNKTGYYNLSKLSSIGFLEGMYYVPRIDKPLLEAHKEGLIILSGALQGEIPQLILNVGEARAEQALGWYVEQFGEDFYLELNRHGMEEEDHANQVMVNFARKHKVKLVAANNSYYLNKNEADAHDALLCIKEGERKSTPIGKGRGFRYGFPNQEFYFKTADEMRKLFADLPEALENTTEILDKVALYELEHDVLLPKFDIPDAFKDAQDEVDGGKRGENAYLRHLTFEGAKQRYGELTEEITERLNFELQTIANTGYPGYFLIVQDFCAAARDMDVSVGPGRGSAAGSAVAYCIGITNVDPIAYDLLFERFLNPERISLPDIDIDFEDEGRDKVIQYVIDKYGSSQVAQIITYGTMAAKSSIRDAGRVLELDLQATDRLAKLVPDFTSLAKILGKEESELKARFNGEDLENVKALKNLLDQDTLEGQTLRQARVLEGSVRNTGTHACGVIITPTDIRDLIPVSTVKDSDMWCTQFDNAVVESAGLLKMDFLGLSTLTIIKEAVGLVKQRHSVDLDPDAFPLDDAKTYELFQRGDTIGIFQYESAGMQKYLRDLKPTVFADLIAMNALYRPGPLEYIPKFVARKHGQEEITYELPEMEEYLAETYGITVYQEQVMLLSQKLAGFTKGEADVLRKAMGKKKRDVLDKMKPQFLSQAKERGHDEQILEKIWKDWEAFASYAFNKSHSTCYAWIAFQTAYLKAHYPAEYMAAVLSNNMADIKKVTFFMEECKRMGVPVLGPDVNESAYRFTVNEEGAVRFGLGGMKGIGEAAVEHIISEREEKGPYTGIFNLVNRIELRIVNKRTLENLALGGAFDSFEHEHRAVYFAQEGDERTFLEKVMRYAQKAKAEEENAQVSLFGESSGEKLPEPPIPTVDEWPRMVMLRKEKEVNGMYLSSHPLDEFKHEIDFFTNNSLAELGNMERLKGHEMTFGAIVTDVNHRIAKNGNGWGLFKVEDYSGDYEFRLFKESYLKFKHLLDTEQMIWVRARVQERVRYFGERQEKELSLEILDIKLLSSLFSEVNGSAELRISLEYVDEGMVDFISTLLKRHKGKQRLKFKVTYADQGIELGLLPKKLKVNFSKEFVDEIHTKPELQLRLN
jgi:DNA polymerase-3 subunit alpha